MVRCNPGKINPVFADSIFHHAYLQVVQIIASRKARVFIEKFHPFFLASFVLVAENVQLSW